ncbi:pre-peptidase C-terminal domain-containing protein [Thermanaerothrix sp. 4228-RoL]|uniref:Pre-peptidase C-terminal domain-containing protein n=1 Tax=Thermanaerothrix solaris TaxID=3058434 RepID=A0ABU3NNA7_9CHLR|nr:pre-peptidase C-terminal domain-containing protein [Thermanaerothrix sp. 4228-RoL]MDT8898325.1 pre-peptidase C-terminal domain-containing protein [Thermanaerothrix sp. 4228-RoL]
MPKFRVLAFGVVLLTLWLTGITQPAWGSPPPPQPQTTPLVDPALAAALEAKINQHQFEVLAFTLYRVKIERVVESPDGRLAVLWLALVDAESGEVIPAEPGLAIARRDTLGALSTDWQVTLQADGDWAQTLAAVPDDLLDPEVRARYAAPSTEQLQALATVYRGYKLPWAGGLKKRLSGSIGHFLWYYSCSIDYCRYAYDFADGTMFPILAARGGTVYMAKWDCPNGSETCSNYIVLKDVTTAPTTYQLYLHLAYDSIPPNLRQVGAIVRQGQFIGNADDTGYSTGHHLHFHVHTNPTWYWGSSVDIRFDDVSINDGTPRNCYEASRWPSYGTQCQDEYVSGNYGAFPPSGNLTLPQAGEVITNGRVLIGGTASDDIAVTRVQPIVRGLDGQWREIGSPFTSTPFVGEIDLCSLGLPNGPVDVAFYAWDYEGNRSPEPLGMRTVLNRSNCAPPPPACTISSTQVALFSQPDYQGACVVLGLGEYSNAGSFGAVGDNNTASILVGSGVRALLYDLPDFQGRTEALEASDTNLGDNPLGRGRLSSLKVQTRSTTLGPPTLITPAYAADLNQPDTLYFTFRSEGATRYRLDVRRHADNQNVFTADGLRSPAAVLGTLPAANPATKYVWRVTAYNSASAGGVSQEQSFEVFPPYLSGGTSPALPYQASFDADGEGWLATGAWQWRTPALSGASAAWVASGNTSGDLTSPPINIPASGTYYLRFRYYADTESPEPYWDQRWLQIAGADGLFRNVWQFYDDPPRTWVESPAISLAAYAGQTIRVRFHFNPLDSYYNGGLGWVVDDLSISAETPPTCGESTPNDTLNTATPLTVGQSASGVICPAGDVDYYRFSGQAGQRLAIRLDAQRNGSPLDAILTLYDAQGNRLAENDDLVLYQMNDPALSYTLPTSGTYYLKVRAWGHPGVGDADQTYTLQVQVDSTPPTLNLTTPATSWVPNGALTMQAQASDGESGVALVNFYWRANPRAPWQLMGQDWDGRDGWTWATSSTALAGGDLYVEAVDFGGNRSGDLRLGLRVDANPPSVSLDPLTTPNRSTAVRLAWAAQDAETGVAGITLQARVGGGDWQPLSGSLTVPRGSAWYVGTWGQTLSFRAQVWDYAGYVSAWSEERSTQIEASCQPDGYEPGDDTLDGATSLGVGVAQEHTLCRGGSGVNDEDWLTVEIADPKPYLFAVRSLDGGAAVRVEIYAADGSTRLATFAAPDLGRDLLFTWTPPQAGRYALRLTPLVTGLAGSAARYSVSYNEAAFLYLPLVSR